MSIIHVLHIMCHSVWDVAQHSLTKYINISITKYMNTLNEINKDHSCSHISSFQVLPSVELEKYSVFRIFSISELQRKNC